MSQKNSIKNIFSHWKKDALAGTITGMMAIPLSVGICLMSEYPIQTGLITVIGACIISFVMYLFKPGNHVGVPGIAAGLAPALAMGVHIFGMENMPFLIALTALIQAAVWYFNWQKYILKAVPHYLVEGLLAGIGLKIALKFLPYTYLAYSDHQQPHFILDQEHLFIMLLSAISFVGFILLYKKYQKTSPAIPYVVVITFGVICTFFFKLPVLDILETPFKFALPLPVFSSITPLFALQMLGFALMLASIDVIEQVMSNAAIEKLDPEKRPCHTNNSLLTIWIANLVSSFFGGMTNLDGLAKSTTNAVAGAYTKLSNLFTALVVGIFVLFPQLLSYMPEFSLGVIMVFSGWKMIIGLSHVIHQGKYPFVLAIFCGVLVFKLGIFEGLILALILHGIISYFFLRNEEVSFAEIWQQMRSKFSEDDHEKLVAAADEFVKMQKLPDYPVLAQWMNNVNARDIIGITNMYDKDAILLPTLSDEIRDPKDKIVDYFIHLLQRDSFKVEMENCVIRDYSYVRLNVGTYTFSWMEDFQPQTLKARFTFAIRDGKILEHHSSILPS